jgi:HSP20 family molecular chaperone IbpA
MGNMDKTPRDIFSLFFEPETKANRSTALADLFSNVCPTPFSMNTNAYIDENGTVNLEIELPGFNKEDIDVYIEKGKLTISAETKTKSENEDETKNKYILRERSTSFKRVFSVGENKKAEDFSVKYENGILYVSFEKEKPEDKTTHRININ